MRVRDILAADWRIGIGGDDIVSPASANPLPVKDDPEGAQLDVFQHDRLRVDLDRLLLKVDLDRLELFGQRQQIRSDDACRCDLGGRMGLGKPSSQGIELCR